MSPEMTKIRDDQARIIANLSLIESWMFEHPQAEDIELLLKFWDPGDRTWMAQIGVADNMTGNHTLLAGSIAAETIWDAIEILVSEIRQTR